MTDNELTDYKGDIRQMDNVTLDNETLWTVVHARQRLDNLTVVQQELIRLMLSQKLNALFHEWRNRDRGENFIRAYNRGVSIS